LAPSAGRELADDIRQNAAVAVVLRFDWNVQPDDHLELLRHAVLACFDRQPLARSQPRRNTGDVKDLRTIQTQRLRRLAREKLQGQHPHTDEVAAVDALETFRQDGAHAQQSWPLRRPVTRAACTVLFSCNHKQWYGGLLISQRSLLNYYEF